MPVDEFGMVHAQEVARVRMRDTLVSIIWGNNEIGTVRPDRRDRSYLRERGIHLHSDAVQSGPFLPLMCKN